MTPRSSSKVAEVLTCIPKLYTKFDVDCNVILCSNVTPEDVQYTGGCHEYSGVIS